MFEEPMIPAALVEPPDEVKIGHMLDYAEQGYTSMSNSGDEIVERLRNDRQYFSGMLKVVAAIDALDPELLKP